MDRVSLLEHLKEHICDSPGLGDHTQGLFADDNLSPTGRPLLIDNFVDLYPDSNTDGRINTSKRKAYVKTDAQKDSDKLVRKRKKEDTALKLTEHPILKEENVALAESNRSLKREKTEVLARYEIDSNARANRLEKIEMRKGEEERLQAAVSKAVETMKEDVTKKAEARILEEQAKAQKKHQKAADKLVHAHLLTLQHATNKIEKRLKTVEVENGALTKQLEIANVNSDVQIIRIKRSNK